MDLRTILKRWLESTGLYKQFWIGKNSAMDPKAERWHIWYHYWSVFEIQDDRVKQSHYDKEILAANQNFFKMLASSLTYSKQYHDEWMKKNYPNRDHVKEVLEQTKHYWSLYK